MGFVFKFLHIGLMFLAVGVEVGSELLLHRVARSGDVRAIRTVFRLAAPLGRAVPILFGLGTILGLVDTFYRGFNPLAPWLLISYAYALYGFVAGAAVRGPWAMKVGKTAALIQGEAPTAELQRLADDPLTGRLQWVSLIGVVVIVFMMVFKPGGM